jgi:hypothetical protein
MGKAGALAQGSDRLPRSAIDQEQAEPEYLA